MLMGNDTLWTQLITYVIMAYSRNKGHIYNLLSLIYRCGEFFWPHMLGYNIEVVIEAVYITVTFNARPGYIAQFVC